MLHRRTRIGASGALGALVAGLAVGSGQAAELAFRQEQPGWFAFDTGTLRGKLRADGRSQGIAGLVHVLTDQEVAAGGSLPGLLSFYRVFSTGKRYGDAARDWPTESKLLPDGSVEVRWPPAEERPLALVAAYRFTRPEALDVRVTVTPTKDLANFEVFLSSYFAKDFDALVYVKPNRFEQGENCFLRADVNPLVDGTYLMFPRDERVVPMIFDGRWEVPPHPVQWSITRRLAAPVAMRRHRASGVAAAILSPAEDCFAVSMPYNKTPPDGVAGHASLYQSLFGRNLAAGQPATARVRLVVGKDLSDETIVAEYRQLAE